MNKVSKTQFIAADYFPFHNNLKYCIGILTKISRWWRIGWCNHNTKKWLYKKGFATRAWLKSISCQVEIKAYFQAPQSKITTKSLYHHICHLCCNHHIFCHPLKHNGFLSICLFAFDNNYNGWTSTTIDI